MFHIEEELKKMDGVKIERPLPTGVIGVIEGAYPGKPLPFGQILMLFL